MGHEQEEIGNVCSPFIVPQVACPLSNRMALVEGIYIYVHLHNCMVISVFSYTCLTSIIIGRCFC